MNNTLYKLENTQTNKSYIGSTTHLKSRLSYHKHCEKHSSGTKIGDAINQYGWATFKVDVLAMVDTQEEADFLEKKFIEEYNSKEDGYNKNNGSKGTVKGTPKAEEHKIHIGQALTGKPKSEEHKAKMSAARIGRKFPRS